MKNDIYTQKEIRAQIAADIQAEKEYAKQNGIELDEEEYYYAFGGTKSYEIARTKMHPDTLDPARYMDSYDFEHWTGKIADYKVALMTPDEIDGDTAEIWILLLEE